MLEKELELELGLYEEVIIHLSSIYPQMHLKNDLFQSETNGYIQGMNSYEMKFAEYLWSQNYYLFREPRIDGCNHLPDFFVYDRQTDSGLLLELTLYYKDFANCNTSKKHRNEVKKSIERKRRQFDDLQNCGIPYLILYREDMEEIRRDYISDLF